jgi:UDP-glucose 4-epimerase
MKKSYLITGGLGFIGTNLVRRLAVSGGQIRVLDNLSSGNIDDLRGWPVEIIIGDIRDEGVVARVVSSADVVIHLAAHTDVVESLAVPRFSMEVNVTGLFNLLQASQRHGVERFIFASTGGAILGDREPPVHEEMAPRPISPYGASKLAGEGYCSAFLGSYGLKTISLRFANIYGPFSYHKGSVIAQFFKQIKNGGELTIYGDGNQTRDFLYVEDLCEAIIKSSQVDLPFGEAIQLGCGEEITVNQMVSVMREVVGEKDFPLVRYAPPRDGEVARNFASIDKALKYLDFSPQTDLLTGLGLTWEWFNQRDSRPGRKKVRQFAAPMAGGVASPLASFS